MNSRKHRYLAILILCGAPLMAQADSSRKLAHDILKELIEINTTDSSGDTTRAAEAMAARFKAAGFPESDIHVLAPVARRGNLVVRYHGSSTTLKPILFSGHLDVVEALREDWSVDPFHFTEQDGYFYGRGTQDMKSDDALLVTTFIRLKQEGFVPVRDLILALTADEEGGTDNGVQWLLKEHRDLIDADYCINADAGGGQIKNGKREFMGVQAAEKTYASFRLDVRNRGGHSSLPVKDNAIYELANALGRLQEFQFPVRMNPVTQSFFERLGSISTGQAAADYRGVARTPPDRAAVDRLSRDPYDNALLRTTCIPTLLKGGHAENALPQLAEAVVNCRMAPGDSEKTVRETLVRVLAEPKIEVTGTKDVVASPFSTLRPDVLNAITEATNNVWPHVPVVPLMETGATDGKWLRIAGIPTFGVSALFIDEDDVRAHGKDERVPEESFYEGIRFDYQLIKRLAGPSGAPVR
ncbi:MAG: M20/M25/M40 family metallo-hydrolase [Bryobacteraceae bacterium]|jgi:acetylornithine deacetylase/succinyl-diaminopimelate desuccinylase-like protein